MDVAREWHLSALHDSLKVMWFDWTIVIIDPGWSPQNSNENQKRVKVQLTQFVASGVHMCGEMAWNIKSSHRSRAIYGWVTAYGKWCNIWFMAKRWHQKSTPKIAHGKWKDRLDGTQIVTCSHRERYQRQQNYTVHTTHHQRFWINSTGNAQ